MSASGEHTRRAARTLPRPARAGFTLIEILAVVLILVLIASVVLPRMSMAVRQVEIDSGQQLAATIDFAREKAVAAGRPHRIVLDFEHGAYWIEAQPLASASEPTLTWAELDELPLVAPPGPADAKFAPLPDQLAETLDASVHFAQVESAEGTLTSGLAQVAFDPDGATTAARIWLAGSGETPVLVDVAAFADPTQVSFGETP
jgi:prepilin-type N-terminal cleavage/methylation domain-containing protein